MVAVPEGLPLAVTLALAYATRRMLYDNNLVRVLAACETMGGATSICSDKTGTLTKNEMTVVAATIGTTLPINSRFDQQAFKQLLLSTQASGASTGTSGDRSQKLSLQQFRTTLFDSIALNSTAFESPGSAERKFVGSKTEIALLNWATQLGMLDYQVIRANAGQRIVHQIPFSSQRKTMSVIMRTIADSGQSSNPVVYRIFTKGASELILESCQKYLQPACDKAGFSELPLDEGAKQKFKDIIVRYASDSLRTIGLAYRDISADEFHQIIGAPPTSTTAAISCLNERQAAALEEFISHKRQLVFLGIMGIEDPVREGVPEAVAKCQKAGVFVRMITGDNVITARAVARKCGILMKGGVVMEGPRFRQLSEEEMLRIIPRLQVLARSSPLDKQILVQKLKRMDETVAVTGDGTNDGPALKMADVGFSMGQAGTEVAKEASDIVLMDDNFSSIVKAMLWGRAVNDSVKKFLQFQLTVNISAVFLAFITALTSTNNESVLSPVQLLWINLIMVSRCCLKSVDYGN